MEAKVVFGLLLLSRHPDSLQFGDDKICSVNLRRTTRSRMRALWTVDFSKGGVFLSFLPASYAYWGKKKGELKLPHRPTLLGEMHQILHCSQQLIP